MLINMKSIVTIMNFRQTCLLVGFSLIFCTLQGQVPASSVEYNDDIPITENNALVDMPFVGGLGHPLYSNGDLNNDGIDDLFIFDAYDNTSHCFIRSSGFLDFSYERTLSLNFPKLSTWAMLADYNCDNIPDLFTPTLEEGDTKNTLDVYS